MNTRILSIAAVAALASTQSFAMNHSDWSVSAAYGILMPVDSKSTTWGDITVANVDGNADETITAGTAEIKQKNVNFYDVSLNHVKSGFGVMYSATAKDGKFEFSDDTQAAKLGTGEFSWKYNGVFATYNHPLGQMLDMNIAVGSVKQTFGYSLPATSVSKRDLGARVGIGAFYNLSKEAALKLGLSYHYFKEFKQVLTNADYATSPTPVNAKGTLNTATPDFNASGLAASVALVYTM